VRRASRQATSHQLPTATIPVSGARSKTIPNALRCGGILLAVVSLSSCAGAATDTLPTETRSVDAATPSQGVVPSPTSIHVPSRLEFVVENSLPFDRPQEVMTLNLALPDGTLADLEHGGFSIHAIGEGTDEEVLSDYNDRSLTRWPSGDVKGFQALFLDDFAAGEIRRYEIRLDEVSAIEVEPLKAEELSVEGLGDSLHLWNGAYDFFIGHEGEPFDLEYGGVLSRDLYIRIASALGWTKSMPLSHIYGNTLEYRDEWVFDGCEPITLLSPGFPEEVQFVISRVSIDVTLRYAGWAHEWCPPAPDYGDLRRSDILDALVTLRVYRGLPRVDARTVVTLHRTFYNHNGFAMGGVETELTRPRVVFGTPNHVVLQGSVWADTEELADLPEFMQFQDSQFVFRRGGNRDAWAPFTPIDQRDTFLDYYVVEGEAGRAVLGYFPDFKDLAYVDTRDEGSGEIVALNMMGAGHSIPVNVANPIVLSQTHLGGLGASGPKSTLGGTNMS
jgi:hypothetical protein